MKNIDSYVLEKLRINQDTKVLKQEYTCQPKNKDELKKIIKERLDKDKDADLNDIDISKITDMHSLFYELDPHNIKIDKWNVSNVEDMGDMFFDCQNFEGKGLENWDVSNVKSMFRMFYNCQKFEGKELENWDVSNVEYMSNMFYNCEKFNCDLYKWDVSNVKDMGYMFAYCEKFEGKGLENWDVSKVEQIYYMFAFCRKFNCNLSMWNVSNVKDMDEMFYRCDSLKNKPSWYKR